MRNHILLLLGGLVAGGLSAPAVSHGGGAHVLHQKRSDETHHDVWVKREPADPATRVPVRIALKQRNLERGMDLVLEVSDPTHGSGKYGQWYSREQIIDLFAPSDESIVKVREWLILSGVAAETIVVPETKGWVHFDATVGQLESLVKADYHLYKHILVRDEGDDADHHLGTDEYHLPEDVAAHVDFIVPGTAFARLAPGPGKSLRRRKSSMNGSGGRPPSRPLPPELESTNPGDCGRVVTPDCLRAMYNIPMGKHANPSNRLGIFELEGEFYVQSDMDRYVKRFAPYVPQNFTPVVYEIDGTPGVSTDINKAGGECMLDFEMAVPLIYPQSTVMYMVPGSGGNRTGIWNPFLDAMDSSYCNRTSHGYTGDTPKIDGSRSRQDCGTVAPTNVISISYGLTEPWYPARYLERQCDEWMKLALAGTTILLASGDAGVADPGLECMGPNHTIFMPDATCDCPYITGVGGTVLQEHKRPGDREVATERFSSGGGFSNIYKTPSYQRQAVQDYLARYPPAFPSYSTSRGQIPKNGGVYNRNGRAYPDLSATGDNGVVAVGGGFFLGAGTSMSAPIVAAIFNLINEERLAAGKSPIGFVNPVLYQHPEMFNDVLVGSQPLGGPSNTGCGNNGGFHCQKGWDPVTGMGTPNYKKMLEVFMSI
ncbi:Tripeptidyl-peptidase I [Purpureocillium takamizusanense]|uniref:Tripeptidyl-peptidase I n=1 Tax=Purpureocillium takamizusanense TaxID=2060973 RepID=A0A9Q8Q6S9_9HYPO|nr:Tripeptidyl-peptidase I [Purpureocillium takamizusanense]UNI14693.1 Tripeptidyl-peptidase I [Purpureocillium takamizusanense]